MVSEPTWQTSLVRHLESDPCRFVNPQRVMPSEIWYNAYGSDGPKAEVGAITLPEFTSMTEVPLM